MTRINIPAIVKKGCVLKVDLEYPQEFCESHNDYPLVPDKILIKREMVSIHETKIAYFQNCSINNVKKLVPSFFDKERYVLINKVYSFI